MERDELILDMLIDLREQQRSTDENVDLLRVDVAGLKVKAGIWGAVAGLVPVVIGLAMTVIALQ